MCSYVSTYYLRMLLICDISNMVFICILLIYLHGVVPLGGSIHGVYTPKKLPNRTGNASKRAFVAARPVRDLHHPELEGGLVEQLFNQTTIH